MRQRIFSLILVIAIILPQIPAKALAAEGGHHLLLPARRGALCAGQPDGGQQTCYTRRYPPDGLPESRERRAVQRRFLR